MFDFFTGLFKSGDSRSELERYIEDELKFREQEFVKYVVMQSRFDVNSAERNWFTSQDKSKQRAYLLLLLECESQSGKETYEQVGNLHFLSPEFKKTRDKNMKKYGLHLWGDEFLQFHEPQLQ